MRLQIGSGFGIPIYMHWTFLLLPLAILWMHPADSALALPLVFTVTAFTFACVVLHEFGHVLMARRFGIATLDVTLYPIGGVARLMRMTDKPIEEILIAVAGPAVNVAIAAILCVGLVPVAIYDLNLVVHSFVGMAVLLLLVANILMVLFNMLPAFPMDGGRVLRALLAWWLGHAQGTRIAVGIGSGVAILMGMAGIFAGSYMLVVIGVFVIFVGQQELAFVRMRERERLRRQERQQWQDEEPLPVVPVRPAWPHMPAAAVQQAPALIFQPRISVYTWDNQTGTWRKEPGT